MNELSRDHLFVNELAAIRGLSKFTIYHWLRESPERLPSAYRWGGRVVFKREDVEAWKGKELLPYHTASRKRGRPTKAEEIAKRKQREGIAA